MTVTSRVLAFAGSTRKESYNKKLVQVAAGAARRAGTDVTLINLHDLPLYDEDLEAEHGMPEPAARLKQIMIEHHGFLIASPEYNSSVTAGQPPGAADGRSTAIRRKRSLNELSST